MIRLSGIEYIVFWCRLEPCYHTVGSVLDLQDTRDIVHTYSQLPDQWGNRVQFVMSVNNHLLGAFLRQIIATMIVTAQA